MQTCLFRLPMQQGLLGPSLSAGHESGSAAVPRVQIVPLLCCCAGQLGRAAAVFHSSFGGKAEGRSLDSSAPAGENMTAVLQPVALWCTLALLQRLQVLAAALPAGNTPLRQGSSPVRLNLLAPAICVTMVLPSPEDLGIQYLSAVFESRDAPLLATQARHMGSQNAKVSRPQHWLEPTQIQPCSQQISPKITPSCLRLWSCSDSQAVLATLQQAGVTPFSQLELPGSSSTHLSLEAGASRLFAVQREAGPVGISESPLDVSLCMDEVSSVAGKYFA